VHAHTQLKVPLRGHLTSCMGLTDSLPLSSSLQVTPSLVMRATRQFRVAQVAAGGFAYQYEGHSVLLTEKSEVRATHRESPHSSAWRRWRQVGSRTSTRATPCCSRRRAR
jgi:hypothetical protein